MSLWSAFCALFETLQMYGMLCRLRRPRRPRRPSSRGSCSARRTWAPSPSRWRRGCCSSMLPARCAPLVAVCGPLVIQGFPSHLQADMKPIEHVEGKSFSRVAQAVDLLSAAAAEAARQRAEAARLAVTVPAVCRQRGSRGWSGAGLLCGSSPSLAPDLLRPRRGRPPTQAAPLQPRGARVRELRTSACKAPGAAAAAALKTQAALLRRLMRATRAGSSLVNRRWHGHAPATMCHWRPLPKPSRASSAHSRYCDQPFI